jgi:hypothetical protein
MKTLILDRTVWDLVVDLSGNIAVADTPYSLAQDAASAIRTFQGECWYDTTLGVPYWTQILGKSPPPIALIQAKLISAAKTVPGVVSAQCFITSFTDRKISGQVQVTDASGQTTAAAF